MRFERGVLEHTRRSVDRIGSDGDARTPEREKIEPLTFRFGEIGHFTLVAFGGLGMRVRLSGLRRGPAFLLIERCGNGRAAAVADHPTRRGVL